MPESYRRKMEPLLRDHLQGDDPRPLVLTGARQTGKTSLVRRIGQELFPHLVEIDLSETDFSRITTAKDLGFAIQSAAAGDLGRYNDTLVFLDNIQLCKGVLPLLAELSEERRHRIVAAGSSLGIADAEGIRAERLHPMDFEEFLWANGIQDSLLFEMKAMFDSCEPVPDGLHRRMMDLFRDYLICGGFPESVSALLDSKDIGTVRDVQRRICGIQSADAVAHDLEYGTRSDAVLRYVPRSMAEGRKRVFVRDIDGKKGARFSDYRESIDSLADSGAVLKVQCSGSPAYPLSGSSKEGMMGICPCDVGILTWKLFGHNVMPLRLGPTGDELDCVFRCYAVTQLAARGREARYTDVRRFEKADLLIETAENEDVLAIWIDPGNRRRRGAMEKLLESEGMDGIVLSCSNAIGCSGRLKSMPVYGLMFL